ncbi:MAU2 chromatid cohesion factor homolog [Phymastichus coffea]|uniref:MAU2 chromatid cohesion factor homolog n=1 Tax=Phymastichus coffea TaxID=108790 RepID=UPI00273A850B|nr:MAU2 chromatid cohesion factor homolog [Phymastichus coffea]
MASSQDAWYLSLLGLAENFRTASPPSIKCCIQCLQAVFNFKPPPRVEARTHLQLGTILLTHTKNIDLARTHLERSWQLSQSINSFDDVKFESASMLADLFEQQHQTVLSQNILRKAVELSQHNVYWHCRLIFQLAQIHASEKDLNAAVGLLAVGADYTQISNAQYTKVLFVLSRCMLQLIDRKFSEVSPLLSSVGHQIENWQGNPHHLSYLKVFYWTLVVTQHLLLGQLKSAKPMLKSLQQSISNQNWPSDEAIAGPHIGDMFIWMPKEHLFILVYLVTVMHSTQTGYLDKAQKYTEKALTQIEHLKVIDNKPILSVFQVMLLEHIVMCRLIMGNKSLAIAEIAQASQICRIQPKLLQTHRAQLHVLLGLYAMSMNCMGEAEAQFISALNKSQERDLVTFANLNLAIVYIRTRRDTELNALVERIKPDNLLSVSYPLRAAAFYVQGLQAFFGARYNEAKRYLRETLKMGNAEDLNRLTSCSLVLLGHIFLSLGNQKESGNMINPALTLASKIPDVHVQLWANAILKDLSRICGDHARETEAFKVHSDFSQTLLKDHFQSTQMSEHVLIQWIEGPIPILPNNSAASTSQAIL